MQMDTLSSKNFLQINDVQEIQVRNFSFSEFSKPERIYFSPAADSSYTQTFIVSIFPNGRSAEYEGYVSIHIGKDSKDSDSTFDSDEDTLSWTFSVVDVDGIQRYYQSFAKANFRNFPYNINVDKFIRRSVLLDQADELLPENVLKVRCELFFMSYRAPESRKSYGAQIHIQDSKTHKENSEVKKEDKFVKCHKNTSWMFYNSRILVAYIQSTLDGLISIKRYGMKASDIKTIWQEEFKNRDAYDEINQTYMSSSPIFRLYSRLKKQMLKFMITGSPVDKSLEEKDELLRNFRLLSPLKKCRK
ncbi:uncharacterized protein CEXT_97271 [Caerostris extrusa]|uniref:MATH domain-containing protein n=1 Tax=Caerostris extrusa TaxID=172846 RepID=A0AAV4NFB3_CAEEX|nr:uncharacterized protein CEXT_97271 [Caerostris extrusa]